MQKQSKFFRRILAIALVVLLCSQSMTKVFAGEKDTIYISSALDFLEFAQNSALDTWSQGKRVVLAKSISLDGLEFDGVPTFGGTFDGNGYTIYCLKIDQAVAPAGLFGELQQGGVIKNLTVEGTVAPAGTGENAGGIVGENYGTVEDCVFRGTVTGKENVGGIVGVNGESGRISGCTNESAVQGEGMTGGIVGANLALVTQCVNTGTVNITDPDPGLDVEDLEISGISDLTGFLSADTLHVAKDTGGIAGYSSGTIRGAENHGEIGYPHVGYNVGGIVGRSCGYVFDCTNEGTVYGRKDIGGIAGQMEPYIKLNLSENAIAELKTELQELSGLIDGIINDAEGGSGTLTDRLQTMSDAVDAAAKALNTVGAYGTVVGKVTGSGTASGSLGTTVTAPTVDVKAGVEENGSLNVEAGTGVGTGGSLDVSAGTSGDVDASGGISAGTDIVVEPTESESGEYRIVPLDASIETGVGTNAGVSVDKQAGASVDVSQGAGVDSYLDVDQSAGISGGVSIDASSGSIDTSGNGTASGVVGASAQISIGVSTGNLTSAINAISGQMRALGTEFQTLSETLSEDLRKLNDKVKSITDIIYEAIEEAENQSLDDAFTDTSAQNVDAVTFGKVRYSTNRASVEGDINIGGIAGSMAMDYDFDPEDDLTSNLSSSVHRAYELKSIIQKCVNYGDVVAKKDCAAGICGAQDLGLIYDSTAYGSAKSDSGNYVGGISGVSCSTILSCYAHLKLSGRNYIGGIVGSGQEDTLTGAGSSVTNCYAAVEIEAATQYYGAIAGVYTGTFTENYFVSDGLQAIDRRSYSGQAEPIGHKLLEKEDALPEEFTEYTLKFVVEDEVILEKTVVYGDSMDASEFPEIPEKEGCYAAWDTESLEEIHFDTVVTAVYTPYVTAIESENERGNYRPVFYVEGEFLEGDQLLVKQLVPDETVKQNSLWMKYETEERWSLYLPQDGSESHRIRFLTENQDAQVMILENGTWKEVQGAYIGSYLTMEAPGEQVEIAVVSSAPVWWVIILAVAVILGTGLILFLMVRKLHRRRKRKKAEKAIQKADGGTQKTGQSLSKEGLVCKGETEEQEETALQEKKQDTEEVESAGIT